jgi:hypothetical protein
MNVKFLAKFLFCNMAMLASVVVAGARSRALFIPVRAMIVKLYSTLPLGVIFTSAGSRMPQRLTLPIAKKTFAVLCKPLSNGKLDATLLANSINHVALMTLSQPVNATFSVAEVMGAPLELVRGARNRLATLRARNRNSFNVSGAVCAFSDFASMYFPALSRAVMVFVFLDLMRLTLDYASTVGASNLDFAFGSFHKKYLLFVTVCPRQAAGQPRIGGRVNDSRSPASGQQMYALDRCIVAQIGGIR